jgi:hypothetical protein
MNGFGGNKSGNLTIRTQKQIRILINRSYEKKRHIHGSWCWKNSRVRTFFT